MKEINLGMSNGDGSIDDGFAEALKEAPGEVFGNHYGWNFCGNVYFKDGQFHEEVYIYRVLQEMISAGTLEDLMTDVCDKYGYN